MRGEGGGYTQVPTTVGAYLYGNTKPPAKRQGANVLVG